MTGWRGNNVERLPKKTQNRIDISFERGIENPTTAKALSSGREASAFLISMTSYISIDPLFTSSTQEWAGLYGNRVE